MTTLTRRTAVLSLMALPLAGCGAGPAQLGPGTEEDVTKLAQVLESLSEDVRAEEAYRAASVAYSETYRLALAYEIEDSPLTHNSKVNLGLKPRGLCYHWADDLEKRMKQERFVTLALHRAVANYDNLLLEHSTLIISAQENDMYRGVVLDPWRQGGTLFWSRTEEDLRYRWTPREEVFRYRRELRARRAR